MSPQVLLQVLPLVLLQVSPQVSPISRKAILIINELSARCERCHLRLADTNKGSHCCEPNLCALKKD